MLFRFSFIKLFIVTVIYCGILSLLLWFFLYRITYYNFPIYDEVYYVDSAVSLLRGEGDTIREHPPLAKWFISVSMYYLGPYWSFSWRLPSLIFGFSGLLLIYIFAKRTGFNRNYAILSALCLVGTKSWYILSRTAMLEIYVSFFVLLAGIFLYEFLWQNNFSQKIGEYKKWHLYWLFNVFLGFAAACKWNGFFPLIFFVVPYWWFYVQGLLRAKLKLIFISVGLTFSVYSILYLSVLRFDVQEFFSNHGFSFLQHNANMLPKNNPITHQAYGGFDAFWRFFVFDQGYFLKVGEYDLAKLSNNHLLALSFALFSGFILIVVVGKIIRTVQKIDFEFPEFIKDRRLWFFYLYSASLILPWAIFPRNQYIYYFVPAFPFVILLMLGFLKSYVPMNIRIFILGLYFAYYFNEIYLTIPLSQ